MRAGTMNRCKATAVTVTSTRSTKSGAMIKTETAGSVFHFQRLTIKEQRALLNHEEATRGSMIIQCRQSPTTEAMTHYRYNGSLYVIEQRTPDEAHHTYEITATLVKE